MIESIAFPSISTGVYAYPKPAAAALAVAEMRRYAAEFERIIACCFSAADAAIYQGLLDAAD